jgi:APA family basic amino acid/polyamine antiporter
MKESQKISWRTGAALVVANMIGTGVFTSLGFQLEDLSNTWTILILWGLGGVLALCGALSYAEVGSTFPRSGGEYHFLGQLYSPSIGYMAGWISLTVGFAAPIALAAKGLAAYVGTVYSMAEWSIALAVLIGVSLIHSFNIKTSSVFQNVVTVIKVVFIIAFILLGLILTPQSSYPDWSGSWSGEVLTGAFLIALVYVSYSYTGWNAAAYIVEEIKNPRKQLPKALLSGTLIVTLLYVLLHFIFLYQAPAYAIRGEIEVGHRVAEYMFGPTVVPWVSLIIALLLVSSISAMVWVGPRVAQSMAEDFELWHFLKAPKESIPVKALWFQTAISTIMILTGTFEQILLYCGFILQASSMMVVAGSFIIRDRYPGQGYRSKWHPFSTLLYLIFGTLVLGFLILEKPAESLIGCIILILGWVTYKLDKSK